MASKHHTIAMNDIHDSNFKIGKSNPDVVIFNVFNIGKFRFALINKKQKIYACQSNTNNFNNFCNIVNKDGRLVCETKIKNSNIDVPTPGLIVFANDINTIYKIICEYNIDNIDYVVPEGVLWEYIRDMKGELSIPYYEYINNLRHTEFKNAPSFGKPIGIIASRLNHNGEIEMGYSLCSKDDKFNFKYGMELAIDRFDEDFEIPHSINNKFDKFYNRSVKYFKVDENEPTKFPNFEKLFNTFKNMDTELNNTPDMIIPINDEYDVIITIKKK